MTDIQAVLAQRGGRYGTMLSNGKTSQALKSVLAAGTNWDLLEDDMKECVQMIAHKLSRIVNGDPTYADSWVDVAGYSQLIVERLEAEAAATTAAPAATITAPSTSDSAQPPATGAQDLAPATAPVIEPEVQTPAAEPETTVTGDASAQQAATTGSDTPATEGETKGTLASLVDKAISGAEVLASDIKDEATSLIQKAETAVGLKARTV